MTLVPGTRVPLILAVFGTLACGFAALPGLSAPLDLTGVWSTGTFSTRLQHGRITHEFAGDRAIMTLDLHNAIPFQTRGLRQKRYGRFRIVGPSASVPGAWEVDITVDRLTLTLLDPDSVWLANRGDADECGLRDWAVKVERDITGRSCGEPMAAAGDVEKILVAPEGDALMISPYWGQGAVESAPPGVAVRAMTLDRLHPLLPVEPAP